MGQTNQTNAYESLRLTLGGAAFSSVSSAWRSRLLILGPTGFHSIIRSILSIMSKLSGDFCETQSASWLRGQRENAGEKEGCKGNHT